MGREHGLGAKRKGPRKRHRALLQTPPRRIFRFFSPPFLFIIWLLFSFIFLLFYVISLIMASSTTAAEADTGSDRVLTCFTCRLVFGDSEKMRDHYKTDLHRFNLKRKVAGLPPVQEALYLQKVAGAQCSLQFPILSSIPSQCFLFLLFTILLF